MSLNSTLFVIPARGGSKGVPHKNTKIIAGRPLVVHSLEYARLFVPDSQICISTDDLALIDLVEKEGYTVPFVRPDDLSTDTSTTFDVLKHALAHYASLGMHWTHVVLLQPTSPFRLRGHLAQMFMDFHQHADVIVSVTESKNNPYFNLFEESQEGSLALSKSSHHITRRQDCPPAYAFNGSLYVFRAASLQNAFGFSDFTYIQKFVMDSRFSVDLDTPKDFAWAQWLWDNQSGEEPLIDWK